MKTEMANTFFYKYGYYGSDQVEAAVYRYMAEELSQENDDPGEIHIPTVRFVAIEPAGKETLVYGTFLIENFRIIDDDIIECNIVGDEAKEMFGRHFEAYAEICKDDDGIAKERLATISEYVRRNGLRVTKMQDEGWEPEPLTQLFLKS